MLERVGVTTDKGGVGSTLTPASLHTEPLPDFNLMFYSEQVDSCDTNLPISSTCSSATLLLPSPGRLHQVPTAGIVDDLTASWRGTFIISLRLQ
jgi:hypothetical protein